MDSKQDFDFLNDIKPTGQHVDFSSIIDIEDFRKKQNIQTYNFNNFEPLAFQAALYHDIMKRPWIKRAFLVLPRRAGKTVFIVVYSLLQAILKAKTTTLPFLRYGLIYPDLANGKDVAWELMEHYMRGLPHLNPNKQRGAMSFILSSDKGLPVKVIIQIVGLKNFDSKRGGGYDGIAIDERGTIPVGFKKVINPMTADLVRQPTFQLSVGTPEESGDFWSDYDLFKEKEDGETRSFIHSGLIMKNLNIYRRTKMRQ